MGGENTEDGSQSRNSALIIVAMIAVLTLAFIVIACIFVQKLFGQTQNTRQHEEELSGVYVSIPAELSEKLEDHVNYDVSYDILYEYDSNDTYADNLKVGISYVRLEGSQLPHLDKINRKISKQTEQFVDELKKKAKENPDVDYFGTSEARVVYNDEQWITIAIMEETWSYDRDSTLDIYNVDLTKGKLRESKDMIRVDDDFAREFRRKATQKYGDDFPDLTDDEIYGYLTDEDTMFAFYTQEGLEVCIIYLMQEGYAGILSVTYAPAQKG